MLAMVLTLVVALCGVTAIAVVTGGVAVGVGCSLLAAAFVSSLDFVKKFTDEGIDRFRRACREAGLEMVHRGRNIASYPDLVARSTSIDVSGYSLASFVNQHGTTIQSRARANVLRVRILLVDPDSQASIDQASLERAAGGTFTAQVERVEQQFADVPAVEIRLVRIALPAMVFRIDERMFIGPHFALPSSQVATFELTPGWMQEQYTEVFETLWKLAKPIEGRDATASG